MGWERRTAFLDAGDCCVGDCAVDLLEGVFCCLDWSLIQTRCRAEEASLSDD